MATIYNTLIGNVSASLYSSTQYKSLSFFYYHRLID